MSDVPNKVGTVGTGGAATAAGIWYQALWTLLQATSASFQEVHYDDKTASSSLRLVLEPYGGDIVLVRSPASRVVQLKTLSHGTWSLKDVIEDVLPDLYRAVNFSKPADVTYEFVTEGRRGRWDAVERFFGSLACSSTEATSESEPQKVYDGLDDTELLTIGGSDGQFWCDYRTTQRGVFDRIVDHLRTLPVAKHEPLQQTRGKVWHLLSRFRFDGGNTEAQVRRNVNEALLSVVEHRERIDNIREGMVGRLIDLSKQNETIVTPKDLFDHFGLAYVIPVCDRARVRARCEERIRHQTRTNGYRLEWDVRRSLSALPAPAADRELIAITGEAGDGKSWRLYAEALASSTMAVVMLDSKGDAEHDLQRAADALWQSVLGHDESLPLENVVRRVADVLGPARGHPWLTICVDRLSNTKAAMELLLFPLRTWGIRCIVACDPTVALIVEQHDRKHPDTVQAERLGNFTVAERNDYLCRRLGDVWVHVPSDVRELLRKPQFASMYCDLTSEPDRSQAPDTGWQPRNEYELIDRYWNRLTCGENADHPKNELYIRRLAGVLLDGSPYPWDTEQLDKADIDDETIMRLIRCGWLRRDDGPRYIMPHDRLLNYAVAQALVERCRSSKADPMMLADILSRLHAGNLGFTSVRLNYVPMDWFYLALKDPATKTQAQDVLVFLEDRLHDSDRMTFHRTLLPTLEAAAVPLLMERLVTLAEQGKWWELDAVLDGVATRPIVELNDRILALLSDARPLVQRAALKLLARRPTAHALDAAWDLHKRMQTNPQVYCSEDESKIEVKRFRLYEDSFDALRSCVQLSPAWLQAAIRNADSTNEPIADLAYLVANLDDEGETWRACKRELVEKVPVDKRRSLALNAGIWRDIDELNCLQQWAGVKQDFLGPAAVRALARIDPARAAEHLRRQPGDLLYFCRDWYLPRLFQTVGDLTRAVLDDYIRNSEDPLRAAQVYQGSENEMDARTLELLLDKLDAELGNLIDTLAVGNRDPSDDRARQCSVGDSLYGPLSLLAAVGRADLLDVYAARAGTQLERRLQRFLIDVIGPRKSVYQDNLSREPATTVLLKIGGEGHCQVIAAFLDADNQYAKFDAIQLAKVDAGTVVLAKLRAIAIGKDLWNGEAPLLQMEAARALAIHGDCTGLIGAVRHLGLQTPGNIEDWLRLDARPEDRVIEDVAEAVRQRSSAQLQGALSVLGLFRHTQSLEDVIVILRDPPDEEARVAAIIALGKMGSAAASAVDLIGRKLGDKRCRWVAIRSLSKIGTFEAQRWLLASLDESWDVQVAIWLAHQPGISEEATVRLARRLNDLDKTEKNRWIDDLDTVLARSSDEVLSDLIRRCSNVQDRLREAALADEGAFWIVGSKAAAIRGLAMFDPYAARLAAEKVLANPNSRDRHHYPALLYRLNANHARELFLSLAQLEHDPATLWSMRYALGPEDADWLRDQLAAASASTRLAASRLAAGPAAGQPMVKVQLISMLNDRSDRVARAIEESLQHLQRQEMAEVLARRFASRAIEGLFQGYRFLEAALQVGEPGYENAPIPSWVRLLSGSAHFQKHPGLAEQFRNSLAKTRKKDLQDATQQAKKRLRKM